MNLRAASLLFAFVFVTLPAFAQGPPGSIPGSGAIQALTNQLAALTERVSKLEGNIVASDLAGSYTLSAFSVPLTGGIPGVRPANISTGAGMATVTLGQDGSASFTFITCGGARLIQGSWALIDDPTACEEDDEDPAFSPHWSYADGILTIFTEEDEAIPFSLAAGGRFGIGAFASFHPQDVSSDALMLILSRLQ